MSALTIDPARREVRIDTQTIDLRTQEFDLLLALAEYRGRVLSREQILQKAWGFDLLRLDGTGWEFTRLTTFNDHEGWKASNPVVSTDGRLMAFQVARTADEAGVGYGILLLRFDAATTGGR